MEDMQKRFDQALAEFRLALKAEDQDAENIAWAKYTDLRFQMAQLKMTAAK